MKGSKVLRQYCRAVSSWLPCCRKQKRAILEKVRTDVSCFLEEHPDAALAEVQARFGAPQNIASAYVDAMDTPQLLRTLRIRRRIVTIVGATMALILLTWALAVAGAIYHENVWHDAVIIDTITVYE